MITLSSNSQSRWKDSLAAAPSINLCLIANGEEKTQVITGKGNIVRAGFDAPTVAPTVVDVGAGNLVNGKFAGYVYVYAATSRYPLVQTATAAGSSVAPRSNPSPSFIFNYGVTGGVHAGNRRVLVTVTKTDRQDIDKIWIYRTQEFDTVELATTAAAGGQLFFIGVVNNNGQVGTATYVDNSLVLQQQVENDNLVAPTAQYAIYYDPFFFLFGENEIEVEVDIDISGLITIKNTFDGAWFNGRDGQFVKFKDIDGGGFDSFGTFYFKWLTSITAQLYLDQALTQLASTPFIGTTKAKIYGFSTTLYRSKPNNPFAWGETIAIGTAVVPQSWVLKVGGGRGVAMTVLPSSSLLKLDLENPSRSYVLNLKQTQTDAFKSTRRLISDTYIPSANSCQFSGLDENKQLQTFAIDSRNFCVFQTDGGNVFPISDPVKNSTRNIIQQSSEHVHFHGFYDPNTECNCFFYREENGLPTVHKMIYNHAPSKQWGTLDCFDLLCSSVIQDKFTGKSIVLGGTASGFVGQLFGPDKSNNWIEQNPAFTLGQITAVQNTLQVIQITPPVPSDELHGRYFVLTGTVVQEAKYTVFYYSQIGAADIGIPVLQVAFVAGAHYTIRYVQISYSNTDTQHDIAVKIGQAIGALNTCSFGPTRFPYTGDVVGVSDIFITVRWKQPVLYSIPLNTYYDFNSGTTISLTKEGGPSIDYYANFWDNTNTVEKNKVVGNWAILEKIANTSNTGIVWGRVKDIILTSDENTFRLYFDLLYVPDLESFIYGLEAFMVNPSTTGILRLMGGGNLLLTVGGHLILSFIPSNGRVYIGINEVLLEKHLDLSDSTSNKNLSEFWIAAKNTNQYDPYDDIEVGYLNQLESDPSLYQNLSQDKSVDGIEGKDNWFIRSPIQIEAFKTFGFSLLQRGPTPLKISNITLKM